MIRILLLLLTLPVGSVAAQAAAIHFTIAAPNHASFRIVHPGLDALAQPLFARGRVELAAAAGAFQGMEVTALDTITPVHIEAVRNGRVIASGDGVYLMVRRDAEGVAIEARSSVPAVVARTLRTPQ